MIFVQRVEKPECLKKEEIVWLEAYKLAHEAWSNEHDEEQKKLLKKVKDTAENKYRHPQISNALKTMFKAKCAFCESKIDHISYQNIEHFFPKVDYPEKCFDWNNLLAACGVCNSPAYKGTKFPVTTLGDTIINPCEDQPDDFFEFAIEADDNSPTGFIAKVLPKNERAEITEETLGLNRIPLLKMRTQSLSPYFPYLAQKAKEGDHEARELLERAAQSEFQYAAFARALLKALDAL
jgi:uncharacterized protein (TIGR02646 family)